MVEARTKEDELPDDRQRVGGKRKKRIEHLVNKK